MRLKHLSGFALGLGIVAIAFPAQANTLTQLYEASLRHFPSLKGYDSSHQALQIEKKSLENDRLFNVSGEAGLSGYNPEGSNGVLLTLTDDIDLLHKGKPAEDKVMGELRKNDLEAMQERQNLFEQVSDHYFNLLQARALAKVLQEDLAWIDKNQALVKKQSNLGYAPAIEVNRWQIERLEQSDQVKTNLQQIEQEENSLKILTGLETIPNEELRMPPSITFSEQTLLAKAPELAISKLDQQSLAFDRQLLQNDWMPGFQLKSTIDTSPSSAGENYALALSMTFKPFHAGKGAALQAIDSQLQRNEYDLQAKSELLRDSFARRIRDNERQRETLKTLQEAKELAQSNLDRLSIAYQKRYVDFMTLWDAHRKQLSLQESYLQTLSELGKNQARLSYLEQGELP